MQQRYQEERYWKDRWVNNQTGWHLSTPHSTLVEFIDLIAPQPNDLLIPRPPPPTVFLPLCGKTLDIHWLKEHGYNVIGCELSEEALRQLFEELGVQPQIAAEQTSQGNVVEAWSCPNVKIYRCNFFDLGKLDVSAVFDRAALVALPAETRSFYAKHMLEITNAAPQILVAFEHQRNTAPPHSVPLDLINEYYSTHYHIEALARRMAFDDIIENSYLLSPRDSANI